MADKKNTNQEAEVKAEETTGTETEKKGLVAKVKERVNEPVTEPRKKKIVKVIAGAAVAAGAFILGGLLKGRSNRSEPVTEPTTNGEFKAMEWSDGSNETVSNN